jgi:hypothetical protein
MTTTDTLLADLADVLERAAKLAAQMAETLAAPPSYWPERMGYLNEVRVGDRVLFAGGWREVALWFEHANGVVTVTFTDPDMDALVDKGTHAIRIQKRADEQQADALHRRDTGGL